MDSPTPSGPPDGPLHSRARDDAAQPPHPARSRNGILTHVGATVAGLLAGVLIGVTTDSSADKGASADVPAAPRTEPHRTITHETGAALHPWADLQPPGQRAADLTKLGHTSQGSPG